MVEHINPQEINDLEGARQALGHLLNLVEEMKAENEKLRTKIQDLRDEISRLKGEQGKPDVKASRKGKKDDHSSEKERREPKKRRKRRKKNHLKIDHEKIVRLDKESLPADAVFKGYAEVVVQDLKIETNNIRFRKEKYYSASQRKTYLAQLPAGYKGQFGPTVRALVLSYYYAAGMSESKIVELLGQMGTEISKGQVSNLLTQKNASWDANAEANEVLQAGLASTSWQHMDDTSTRVNGVNQHCHVLCNPYYSWYATRPGKDRLTVIAVLQNTAELVYLLNEQTSHWLGQFAVPQWAQTLLQQWPQGELLGQAELDELSERDLAARLNDQQLNRVREAAALTAYHSQTDVPVVPILVSDDAPQFRDITLEHALCWVHDGRHYKKLTPFVAYHRKLLDQFLKQYWEYYHRLQHYRSDPSPAQAKLLQQEFVTLFSTQTGYAELDKRIAKTLAKREQLLVALRHAEVPLHNNPAELTARQRVRKRDVSFGPRTDDGRQAWDTFMTLAETAKKLGISFYAYAFDRVAENNRLPNLADLIRLHAAFQVEGATSLTAIY